MTEPLTGWLVTFALALVPVFVLYFLLYNCYLLWLIALSVSQLRRRVTARSVQDLDLIDDGDLTRPLTIIVPVCNGEGTVLDRVMSLIRCDYPRFEVVLVSDGSSDGTLDRLKHAFRLRRSEVPYRPGIGTAPVRAMHEATVPLPANVLRVIVVDKEPGGRADAFNAGINVSTAPYFVPLGEESILNERALKELMRAVQENPGAAAVAGPVAIANGCTIRNRRVVDVGLPARSLPRFQMVEYLRLLATAGSGRDRLRPLLMLRGVLAVFEKETVIRAGGYLTSFLHHRIPREYVGDTVGAECEQLEIIVRLHRFMLDKLHGRRIVFLPHTVAWSRVPETFGSLRREIARQYRGLREVLRYHRAMLGRRRYGGIGSFALPALWLFEYYGPLVEMAAYLCVLFVLLMERLLEYPVLDYAYLWVFLLASVGFGILVNVLAVMLGAWRVRLGLSDRRQGHVLPFSRRRQVLILLAYAALENFGYRQLTLLWRFKGLWGAWRGKTGPPKIARGGLPRDAAPVHG